MFLKRLALARTTDDIFFFLHEKCFCFVNGFRRRAVRKLGDCFGTDSSGKPFERRDGNIVFEQIARAIRNSLVHHKDV